MVYESFQAWSRMTHLPVVDTADPNNRVVYWAGIPMPLEAALVAACYIVGQPLAQSVRRAATEKFLDWVTAGNLRYPDGTVPEEVEKTAARISSGADIQSRVMWVLQKHCRSLKLEGVPIKDKKELFRILLQD